jgi:hypothetical protein
VRTGSQRARFQAAVIGHSRRQASGAEVSRNRCKNRLPAAHPRSPVSK